MSGCCYGDQRADLRRGFSQQRLVDDLEPVGLATNMQRGPADQSIQVAVVGGIRCFSNKTDSNDWNELQKSLKLETHISLTSFNHQLSEQLTDHCICTQPICKQPIQLPHPHTVIYSIYFAPLQPSISTCTLIFCTSITPVFNCYIVIISPLWPIYCLTSLILPHLHTLYIDFLDCIIDCMFVYSMCNSVLLFVLHCFALSWPGRSCK